MCYQNRTTAKAIDSAQPAYGAFFQGAGRSKDGGWLMRERGVVAAAGLRAREGLPRRGLLVLQRSGVRLEVERSRPRDGVAIGVAVAAQRDADDCSAWSAQCGCRAGCAGRGLGLRLTRCRPRMCSATGSPVVEWLAYPLNDA